MIITICASFRKAIRISVVMVVVVGMIKISHPYPLDGANNIKILMYYYYYYYHYYYYWPTSLVSLLSNLRLISCTSKTLTAGG